MKRVQAIDSPRSRSATARAGRDLPSEGRGLRTGDVGSLPQQGRGRCVEVQTVVIPSIPLVETRQKFLADLRLKTSRLSGKRITPGTVEKYRHWLNRFERWLLASELP